MKNLNLRWRWTAVILSYLILAFMLYFLLVKILPWMTFNATFLDDDLCSKNNGACWPVITDTFSFLIFGPAQNTGPGGFVLTVTLTLVGGSAALLGGVLLLWLRSYPLGFISYFANAFVEFIRGVPLITLLFLGHYLLPLFIAVSPFSRALFVMILFGSTYMSEALRGGRNALPTGQFEACHSLGLGFWRSEIFVLMPQVFNVAKPALIGTWIGFLKDTTLITIIGLYDALGAARAISAMDRWKGYDVEPLFVTAMLFLLLTFMLGKFAHASNSKSD